MPSSLRLAAAICIAVTAAAPSTGAAGNAASRALEPRIAQTGRTVRITGVVRDEQNAMTLPGVTVTVLATSETVATDLDGRYTVDLPTGRHQIRIAMDGYQERILDIEATGERTITADVSLSMTRFAEEVTVTGQATDASTSTQEAQLIERKNAQVITDNMGAQEMRSNGDTDAAAALQRVPGISVVDNQYVFVRGLGERYSNTTLAGSVIPTTEPDKKVVPLDLFPTALIDSVQIAKSYTPDRSAEFAGGLVEIIPQKMPGRQMFDAAIGFNWYETASGDDIPLSSLDGMDRLGYDDGARVLPAGFPSDKIVRQGIFTPEVGYGRDEITQFGRQLDTSVWRPQRSSGDVGPSFNLSYGNRFDRLGVLASVNQSYKEQYVEEVRRFYRLGEDNALEAVTDYAFQTGTQKAQLGVVANVAWQFDPGNRISFDNFYTHTGRDEGRVFEGPNLENNFVYRNYRLQFIEEGLFTNRLSGDHLFDRWGNSRLDWRASYGKADRNEPDLRETLYQQSIVNGVGTGNFLLADESQSGFRMFNTLDDETFDVAANWTSFQTLAGRPVVYKFGPSFVRRTRGFQSRRFRYIPANTSGVNLAQDPEVLFATNNIGTVFRFNEETRPVDAYDAEQNVVSVYGMGDWVLSSRSRLVAGLRVEAFDETVNSFDPFGLFTATVTAELDNTDVFPGVNFVYALRPNTNLRLGYSTTTNRPEFRELAAFEFTDVVGNRAVRGNPALVRSLIQNLDARVEAFTGSRGVVAASVFYKYFQDPIERVINAGAQPLQTFENADSARNIGFELEAGRQIGPNAYASLNYTFVDSEVTLSQSARQVQTSQVRALAGQSQNLLNLIGEISFGGFQGRVLYNFFDDRISDVGANQAPDIIENGRGQLDVVFIQRYRGLAFRLTLDNLLDEDYLYTQGDQTQRLYNTGRAVMFSLGYSFF
ncbi:MAG TPA: TonB-dependent receptor [Vicinamibacterales bacterium]|nr:TonB-dependent receptor [Vicinamibacterales bacterium]